MAINTINGTLVTGIPIGNVTGLQAALDAAGGGTIEIADVQGLQTVLDAKYSADNPPAAADISDATIAGRNMLTAATTSAQAALLPLFSRTARGMVPSAPAGTGTAKFLREDGTWAEPTIQSAVSDVRLGSTSSTAASGYVVTNTTVGVASSFSNNEVSNVVTVTLTTRPIQKNVNGVWLTVTSI